MWNIQKKKPLVTTSHSSGGTPTGAGELWVTAVATLPYTDLIASGEQYNNVYTLILLFYRLK